MIATLAAFAGLEIKDAAARGIRFALLLVLAGVMAFGALFFGLGALRTDLSMSIGPINADLAIAGGLVLASALLAGAAFIAKRRKSQASRTAQTAAIVATPVAIRTLGLIAPHLLRAAPVAIVGGFLLGRLLSGSKET